MILSFAYILLKLIVLRLQKLKTLKNNNYSKILFTYDFHDGVHC